MLRNLVLHCSMTMIRMVVMVILVPMFDIRSYATSHGIVVFLGKMRESLQNSTPWRFQLRQAFWPPPPKARRKLSESNSGWESFRQTSVFQGICEEGTYIKHKEGSNDMETFGWNPNPMSIVIRGKAFHRPNFRKIRSQTHKGPWQLSSAELSSLQGTMRLSPGASYLLRPGFTPNELSGEPELHGLKPNPNPSCPRATLVCWQPSGIVDLEGGPGWGFFWGACTMVIDTNMHVGPLDNRQHLYCMCLKNVLAFWLHLDRHRLNPFKSNPLHAPHRDDQHVRDEYECFQAPPRFQRLDRSLFYRPFGLWL